MHWDRPLSIVEIRESMVFLVLNDRLELSLARELAFELVALADSLVSISSVDLRFFLVWTTISPGRGRFDPSVNVSTESSVFLARNTIFRLPMSASVSVIGGILKVMSSSKPRRSLTSRSSSEETFLVIRS